MRPLGGADASGFGDEWPAGCGTGGPGCGCGPDLYVDAACDGDGALAFGAALDALAPASTSKRLEGSDAADRSVASGARDAEGSGLLAVTIGNGGSSVVSAWAGRRARTTIATTRTLSANAIEPPITAMAPLEVVMGSTTAASVRARPAPGRPVSG